jgi:hypothetical protein
MLTEVDPALDLRALGAPHFWCVFGPAALSYRCSLPSKFFQAMAWGVSILANRSTCLARLVRRPGLHVLMDAAATVQAVDWEPDTYRSAADSTRRFRTALRRTQVVT